MANIYDLDNEGGGGVILTDSNAGAPALRVNSNSAGQAALAIQSTPSTNPVVVDSFGTIGGSLFRGVTTNARGLQVSRTVIGSSTIAPLLIAHTSSASAAAIEFGGSFISVTSVLGIGATGAAIAFDYVIPVSLNGVVRGIPVTSLISLTGAAVF